MPKIIDLTGQKFGLLTADYIHERRGVYTFWHCTCECGGSANVRVASLRNGTTKSCGCQKGSPRHGMCDSSTYKIWTGIKQRCTNPANHAYQWYGANGITICERWADSFDNFLADMGPHTKGMSIDRIDGTKGYSPENCRWATYSEQSNNRSSNVWIEYGGERLTAAQWSHRLNGTRQLVKDRLRRGWSVADAVTLPHKSIEHFMPDGTPAVDVARRNGVCVKAFQARICKLGWDVVRAATTPVDATKNHSKRNT